MKRTMTMFSVAIASTLFATTIAFAKPHRMWEGGPRGGHAGDLFAELDANKDGKVEGLYGTCSLVPRIPSTQQA